MKDEIKRPVKLTKHTWSDYHLGDTNGKPLASIHRSASNSAHAIALYIEHGPALIAACRDAEAAIEWEDPYNETRMSREERLDECLKMIRAALAPFAPTQNT